MVPMVPAKNISGAPQHLAGVWIAPQETVDLAYPDAVTFRDVPEIQFDWEVGNAALLPSVVDDRIVGLSFVSPFSLYDGYGLVGVYTVRELLRRGVELDLYKSGWLIEHGLDQAILDLLQAPKRHYRLAVAKGPPLEVLPVVPHPHPIFHTMWESTPLPPAWVPLLNRLPLGIVPTRAQIEIFRESGVTIPLSIVPDPIDTDFWSERTTFPDPGGPFTFVSWARMSGRKMPVEMIQTFLAAFPREQYPDVRLELKTTGGQLGGGRHNIPVMRDDRIVIHDGAWGLDELKAWVGTGHCGYFLSRGEGMMNPPMQAMALGLPTIVANHSGPADYADERYNWPVELDPHEPLVESPMGDNMRWWNPDLEMAADRLRAVYDDYDEALRRAAAARPMAIDRYNIPRFVDNLTRELVKVAS